MRVIVQRNAHLATRGQNAPELVYLDLAARLVTRQQVSADPVFPQNATSIGRDILAAVDGIPGIDSVRAERHQLILTIAKAFDSEVVLAEVFDAISTAIGEPLS